MARGRKAGKHEGSSIDEFLKEEGVFEEFQARAVKEVIAWQLARAMKERKLSKRRLAAMMHTSRTQVDRVLDPNDGNVTIETFQRAAAIVGRKVQVELVRERGFKPPASDKGHEEGRLSFRIASEANRSASRSRPPGRDP